MSNFKQEPFSPMGQSCVDPLDYDRFLNFDQSVYPSPSVASSSSNSSRGKAIATPELTFANPPDNVHFSIQETTQPIYNGPSHQYHSYKQQTGIPSGALASTLAVNQPNTFPFGAYQQDYTVTDGYFGTNTTGEIFDFNTLPTHNPSFSATVDMDMDFDSSEDPFSMTNSQSSSGDYVDPNAIGGQEDISAASTPVQSSAVRVWPGMHQQQAQQAALAKAQVLQKQQQQQRRIVQQPQIVSQPPRQPARQTAARNVGGSTRPPTDPIVEERISRLLNQMRQNSEASSHDDDNIANGGGLPHLARQRKDEEDMDEDERLLASEEGKKLSSKERRQLRNKVSARAFRSRRKEYIGQLEGEIATKVKDADDLRKENEDLKAENTRLTDLTRMLLASPAFSTFLNDLSGNEGMASSKVISETPIQPSNVDNQQFKANPRKDANPNQQNIQNQQSNDHIGKAFIPENSMDFSVLNSTSNTWDSNMDFGFNNAQVFSVVELPQGPAVDSIDIGLLSGKSSNSVGIFSSEESKNDAPIIERMPASDAKVSTKQYSQESNDSVDFDESDPAFALFADSPAPVQLDHEYRVFGEIEVEKALACIELVVDSASEDHVSAATMDRFERLCSSMDEAFDRVSSVTSHLCCIRQSPLFSG